MKKNQSEEQPEQTETEQLHNQPAAGDGDQAKDTAPVVDSLSEGHESGGSAPVDDQLDELTRDLQRVQAEFLNFKRRAEQERTDASQFARTRVVREFLAVRDSFDQEAQHRPADIDAKWAASIDSIRTQFDKVLKNLGVERFEAVGRAFDPHRHEAIVMEDGDGKHEVVTEELQAGYSLGDTVLRHAMVKVGRTDDEVTS